MKINHIFIVGVCYLMEQINKTTYKWVSNKTSHVVFYRDDFRIVKYLSNTYKMKTGPFAH